MTATYEIRTEQRRDVRQLAKGIGWGATGFAVAGAIWWWHPSIWAVKTYAKSSAHEPDLVVIAIYGAAAVCGLLGIACVGVFLVGMVRGFVVATCPQCNAAVLVGAATELPCPKCKVQLRVTSTTPATP